MDADEMLARYLQSEFDKQLTECTDFSKSDNKIYSTSNDKKVSLCDPSLEITDPNPDVHTLFLQFNQQFFWGKLAGVEVRWSPRMTLCAGLCSYERRGGLCSIRLSVPLLKLRPRKDLVETLLHEMIHAYLFVTQNNKDHDAHGPEFHKHMYRINQQTDTKITVYHNFHDEVKLYKQHWWKCTGPCKNRPPFYGLVKRSMNRKPGPNDFWWKEHQQTCNGNFIKIKEPEDYKDKHKGKSSLDQENAANQGKGISSMSPFTGKGKKLGASNAKLNSETKPRLIVDFFSKSSPIKMCSNATVQQESKPKLASSSVLSSSSINQARIDYFLKKGISAGPASSTVTSNSFTKLKRLSNNTKSVENKDKSKKMSDKSNRLPIGSKRKFSDGSLETGQKTSKYPKHCLDNSSHQSSKANIFTKEKTVKSHDFVAPSNSTNQVRAKQGDSSAIDSETEPSASLIDLTKSLCYPCPVCGESIEENVMNSHLDHCLLST